ncbi:hypothetical protein JCM9279_007198 [Rhodotorula babjevae]
MAVVPPDSLALIASLHQADLAELRQLRATSAGSTKTQDNEQAALALYEQDLADLLQDEQDAKDARNFAGAAVADEPLLRALAREEEAARQDHALALQLSIEVSEDGDDEPMPQDYYFRPGEAAAPPQELDSPPFASTSTSSSSSEQRTECIACTDSFLSSDLVRVPCKDEHPYCGGCMHDLFVAATKDETLFPPRCDNVDISLDLVKPHLSPQELFEYQRSAVEFRTPDRLYCSTTTCSAFLGSASGVRTAIQCRACQGSTCAACKAPWHGPFGLCGASEDDEAVRALERDFEYRQCPSCKRVVELESGCHHISCRCGHEFCYLCAAKWQTCDCPLWEERRLLVARDVYGEAWFRNGGAGGLAPGEMDLPADLDPMLDDEPWLRGLVRVPDDVIEVVNACEHPQAVKREGPGECEVCRDHLNRFIMRCTFCYMDLCVRCRRNRGRRPRR